MGESDLINGTSQADPTNPDTDPKTDQGTKGDRDKEPKPPEED